MTPITTQSANCLLNRISKCTQQEPPSDLQDKQLNNNPLYLYELEYSSECSTEVRYIAIKELDENQGIVVYVSSLSTHKIYYSDFFDSVTWVEEELLERRSEIGKHIYSRLYKKDEIKVMKLCLKFDEEFRILLSWYMGLCYTQYEIHKILLSKADIFPKARYELSCPKTIDESNLSRKKLLNYFLSVFDIKAKPFYHKKTIAKIIGNELEEYFFDNERSNYFKVLSLFSFLSIAKNGWHELMLNDTKFPSMSNNPVTTEFDGFQDQESIHTNDNKRLNDAILRIYYQKLIQSVLNDRPDLNHLLLPKNECATNFDQQLARFDDYIQKLFNLCWERWTSVQNRDRSNSLDKTYLDVQKYVDEHLKRFSAKFGLIEKDNLMLTLIKHSSLNRAKQDYDFFLDMYPGLSNEIPDRIYLMRLVNSPAEIIYLLQGIFDIKKHEIPDNLLECATIVIEMYVRFYNLDASPDERDEFKHKMYRYPYIGASATLLLNGYIKNNKFRSRTKVNKEYTNRIKGGTNNEINVYNWLSKVNESYIKKEKSLSALLYCMPDSLYKFLTARHDLVVAIMEDHRPVQVVVNDALELKKRRAEFRKEVIEKMELHSIEYINSFIEYFIDTFNKFERLINIPGISNLWRNH